MRLRWSAGTERLTSAAMASPRPASSALDSACSAACPHTFVVQLWSIRP